MLAAVLLGIAVIALILGHAFLALILAIIAVVLFVV